MTLTIAGWLLVALPLTLCAGVWWGVRLERAQQTINRSRELLDPWDPAETLDRIAVEAPLWGRVRVPQRRDQS